MQRISQGLVKTWRVARNMLVDLRYGGFLGANLKLSNILRRPDKEHRFVYFFNSDTQALEYIFANRVKPDDVLVDVGCGKGRVLNWWLYKGYKNRLIGLELNADVAEQARERLKKYPNVSIVTGSAVDNVPPDATIFYMYNPLPAPVMEAFKDRVKEVFAEKRNITLLYYSPKALHVFENDPTWNIKMETVGDSATLPFPALAVITMK